MKLLASLEEVIEYLSELVTDLIEFGHQIDTSNLSASTLYIWVKYLIEHEHSRFTLIFESFGFKRGVLHDANFVFDIRILPNPYYVQSLRPLTGLDQPVIDFLAPYSLCMR